MTIQTKLEELNSLRLSMIEDVKKVGNFLPSSTKYQDILTWYKTYKDLETPSNIVVKFENSKVELAWDADGMIDSYTIYRSEQPINIENLPTPLAENITQKSFTDENVDVDKEYYYRIASIRSNALRVSEQIQVFTYNSTLIAPTNVTFEVIEY